MDATVPHVSVQRVRVGTASLRRHDVRLLVDEPALAMSFALGPPRLWSYLLDAALAGFEDGYRRPHDGRVTTRIHQGVRVAQSTLRARIDALIDRRRADAALLALARDGDQLHVLVAGGLRAYVYRRDALALLADGGGEQQDGLLKLEPVWCTEPVERGDMLFVGASALCDDGLLSHVQHALRADRNMHPAALSELLGRGADERGQGAATVAFRIASS